MSEMSEKARAASKDKAERMTRSDPHARVDASGYAPEGALDGNVQTGPRSVSRRQFRRGGKVDGVAAAPRADRKQRASGGPLTADSYLNRNVKTANEERAGTKHVGGMKSGGRAEAMQARVHKLIGGALTPAQKIGMRPARAAGGGVHEDAAQDRKLIHKEVHEMGCKCERCGGGRVKRASGGVAPSKPPFQEHFSKLVDRSRSGDRHAEKVLERWTDKTRKPRKDGGKADHWIAGAIKHPGSLRKALHVKEGHDIPQGKLEKAEHSKNPKLAKKAHLAETLEHLPHKKSGGSVSRGTINDGTRPTGGRLARKGGGRAKKGTNVNIIIAPQGAGAGAPPVRPLPMPAPGAVPMPAGPAPVGLHQGAPPVMAAGPGTGMPMRAAGGRTYPIDAGAGSGLGRLEKAERASRS